LAKRGFRGVNTSESGILDNEHDGGRRLLPAMLKGWFGRCPSCGKGGLFTKYLKVDDACPACREELHHHRADDAPPYFTIVIVGHIIVPMTLIVERNWSPELWQHFVVWLPLTLGLTLWVLPKVKGALVGLQWAVRMHGFGDKRT
jgi:uncharacterized protein (DUF983 family)